MGQRQTWNHTDLEWNIGKVAVQHEYHSLTNDELVMKLTKAVKIMTKGGLRDITHSHLAKHTSKDGLDPAKLDKAWKAHKKTVLDIVFSDFHIMVMKLENKQTDQTLSSIKALFEGPLPARPAVKTRVRTPKNAHLTQVRQALTNTVNSKKSKPIEVKEAKRLLAILKEQEK